MNTHTYDTPLAASGTVQNIYQGTIWEQLQQPAMYRIFAVQDGAAAATPLRCQITAGNVIRATDGTRIPAYTAGQGPDKDKHLLAEFGVNAGDRVVMSLRNTDPANTSNVRIYTEISF